MALLCKSVKNPNKNPVAENCIAEVGDEFLRICPEYGTVTPLSLAVATANLNTHIRNRGFLPVRCHFNVINSPMHRSVLQTSKLFDNSTPCSLVAILLVRDLKPLAAVLALPYPFRSAIWFTLLLMAPRHMPTIVFLWSLWMACATKYVSLLVHSCVLPPITSVDTVCRECYRIPDLTETTANLSTIKASIPTLKIKTKSLLPLGMLTRNPLTFLLLRALRILLLL